MRMPAPRIASKSMHVAEVADVGVEIIVLVRGRRAQRACASGMRFTPSRPPSSSALARCLDPAGDVGVGRAAVRRVVLEAAVFGRIVRRRDDDAVGEPAGAAAVVDEDRVRDRRRRRVFAVRARSCISTPFAASTSSALAKAGSDSACVSMPRNSGPSMPCARGTRRSPG